MAKQQVAQSMHKSKVGVPLVLILISLVWAGSFIAVKVTVGEIPPVQLGFLRFVVAIPFMLLVALVRKSKFSMPLKMLPYLLILALTGVTLLYIFQFIGIDYTTASTAAVLINTNVLFIALLSATFLKEPFSVKKMAGILISFFGVVVVLFAQMNNEAILFSPLFFIGSIFVILSAFCWAIYSIVGKHLIQTYDNIMVTTYAFIIGTLFFLPVVLPDVLYTIPHISFNGWLAVFYLSVLCSVFGYVGWYYALSKAEAGRTAVFLNFIPLFAILLSFFIEEIPTPLFLVGAILIIYGVYLTQKPDHRDPSCSA